MKEKKKDNKWEKFKREKVLRFPKEREQGRNIT